MNPEQKPYILLEMGDSRLSRNGVRAELQRFLKNEGLDVEVKTHKLSDHNPAMIIARLREYHDKINSDPQLQGIPTIALCPARKISPPKELPENIQFIPKNVMLHLTGDNPSPCPAETEPLITKLREAILDTFRPESAPPVADAEIQIEIEADRPLPSARGGGRTP
ncbi:MAG: hypothetical protein ACN2B6_08965 [Rickettsiales bacterium]